jgi:hypothetical protein
MVKSLSIWVGNFDRKMVGWIVLEFTYNILNVDEKKFTIF